MSGIKMGHHFPAEFGFTGSAGHSKVSGYMRGGTKGGHFIQKAIKRPGALHRALHVPKGEKIPEKKIERAEHSSNKRVAREARFAETLKGMHHKKGGKHYAVGGCVTKEEYAPPSKERSNFARGGHVSAGKSSPSKMGGFPKTAPHTGRKVASGGKFPRFAKGGVLKSPVKKVAKPNDADGGFEDYKRGGRC